jgi:hypothetical protein
MFQWHARRARCAGLPEVIEGPGCLDGRQAGGKVDPEAAGSGGEVPELVPPHRLRSDVGGQAQQDSEFGVDDRYRGGETSARTTTLPGRGRR